MDMDCSLEYRVEGGDESHRGQMKNLSAAGIRFSCEHELTPGCRISITLTPLNNLTPPMSADVVVARCDPDQGRAFIVAGQIEQIH